MEFHESSGADTEEKLGLALHKGSSLGRIGIFSTACQTQNVAGIVLYLDHLFTVHHDHDTIYVYKDRKLLNKINVPKMKNPWGLAVAESGDTTHLVVCDGNMGWLWWVKIIQEGNKLSLGKPEPHELTYSPWGAVSNCKGQVVVVDHYNCSLHLYDSPRHEVQCLQLPVGVRPSRVAADPWGGYGVREQNNLLVWVNGAGQVTCRYTDQPVVLCDHMVHDGTGSWLVADYQNHLVHMVTNKGKHAGHLLGLNQGIKYPHCLCVDIPSRRLWLAHYAQKAREIVISEMAA